MPLSRRALAELTRQQQPAQQIPPMPACARCGGIERHYGWQQRRDGGRHIRVECRGCGQFLKFAPQVEPFVGFANNRASQTAILDVLIGCDGLGIDLTSDGQAVSFTRPEDNHREPQRLRELVRQCSHDLAGLMGRKP
jgi:hypothetical protein